MNGKHIHPAAGFLFLALTAGLVLPGCATNPATGQRQLALMSESEEIQMGRQADEEIVATMGLYDDDNLQAYVDRLGRELAARSERSDLPWAFRVLDDPIVNAFALPGGYIYVTRGILAHLSSEAELAAVLGHEIGHVTARHAVSRISKAQLLTLGLGVGMAVKPELQQFGQLAEMGLGLLFLKYSRDDERQADDLGLRYMTRGGYDAREMPEVFSVLERVGEEADGGRIPSWLSTHPDPGQRARRIGDEVGGGGQNFEGARVGRRSYFDRLDGMVFGDNPREGFFRGASFFHPELAFGLDFPLGWTTRNQRQRVLAVSPDQDALVELSLAREQSPEAAARQFLAQEGVSPGRSWRKNIHGMTAVWNSFAVQRDPELAGVAVFVAHGGRVYQLLGFGLERTWLKYQSPTERAFESFRRITDPAILEIEPARLEIVKLDQSLTLGGLEARYPSSVPSRTIAIINHLDDGAELEAGQLFKRVVGGPDADLEPAAEGSGV